VKKKDRVELRRPGFPFIENYHFRLVTTAEMNEGIKKEQPFGELFFSSFLESVRNNPTTLPYVFGGRGRG